MFRSILCGVITIFGHPSFLSPTSLLLNLVLVLEGWRILGSFEIFGAELFDCQTTALCLTEFIQPFQDGYLGDFDSIDNLPDNSAEIVHACC